MTTRISDNSADIRRMDESRQRESLDRNRKQVFDAALKTTQQKQQAVVAKQKEGTASPDQKKILAKANLPQPGRPTNASKPSENKKADLRTSRESKTNSEATAHLGDTTEKKQLKKNSENDNRNASRDQHTREDLAYAHAIKENQGNNQQSGDGKNQQSSSDEFFQQTINMVAPPPPPKTESKFAAGTHISDAVLNQLISNVSIGVNEKGLKQFSIQFSSDTLNGATMNVSTDKGKVFISFHGLDESTKKELSSHLGDIKSRLKTKNLDLAEMNLF